MIKTIFIDIFVLPFNYSLISQSKVFSPKKGFTFFILAPLLFDLSLPKLCHTTP